MSAKDHVEPILMECGTGFQPVRTRVENPCRILRFAQRSRLLCAFSLALFLVAGCQSAHLNRSGATPGTSRKPRPYPAVAIQRIACVYDQRPWLNLDSHGDRAPEGFWFRAFLDPGTGKGVFADGQFNIELYEIARGPGGETHRRLAGDWHYRSNEVNTIAKPGMLGRGFWVQLAWTDPNIVGKEIEIVTRFEDKFGNTARAGVKRLRVPKYES